MKRKFIIICVVIFAFVFVVVSLLSWRGKLATEVDAKLQEIRAVGLPTNGKELNAFYDITFTVER